MEEKIVYFKNSGKENTADVVKLVLKKGKDKKYQEDCSGINPRIYC